MKQYTSLKNFLPFAPSFKVGQVVTNQQLMSEFKVGNMGGMRKSNVTGTLVIISDHTKALYDDKRYGDELHYTGMGKHGDQALASENKVLAESGHNGIEVHLFEVLKRKEYIYQGVVELCGEPYQEQQKDEDGILRKVWMFPLKTVLDISSVKAEAFDAFIKAQEKKAKQLPLDELKAKAEERSSIKVAHRAVIADTYIRDPYIAEYAKVRANGICQLCSSPAPFATKDGTPYLESHHLIWLAEGGADSIENTVALCPNCHKKMHIVNDEADVERLKAIVSIIV